MKFFSIPGASPQDVHLLRYPDGQLTGEAYFVLPSVALKAQVLAQNRAKFSNRELAILPARKADVYQYLDGKGHKAGKPAREPLDVGRKRVDAAPDSGPGQRHSRSRSRSRSHSRSRSYSPSHNRSRSRSRNHTRNRSPSPSRRRSRSPSRRRRSPNGGHGRDRTPAVERGREPAREAHGEDSRDRLPRSAGLPSARMLAQQQWEHPQFDSHSETDPRMLRP
ncbi:MAG: hypothetical protein ACK4F6_19165, partial [Hylemonella sp.]